MIPPGYQAPWNYVTYFVAVAEELNVQAKNFEAYSLRIESANAISPGDVLELPGREVGCGPIETLWAANLHRLLQQIDYTLAIDFNRRECASTVADRWRRRTMQR